MKPLFIICLLFSCFLASLAQAQVDSGFTLVKTYRGDITDAVMDNLDNLYIISSSGQVRKFNEKGDSVAIYNQVRNAGKLFSLDVSNPLRPLLFYKDFSTIVLLDRFLANRASIDLKRFNILQPGAAGVSYDNNIWVFDEYDNKLKKVDEQGKLLVETPDLRTLFPVSVHPQKILSDNGLVYLADTSNGVFVFDNYGAYKKKIGVTKWQSIMVKENYIIQTHPNEIIVYNSSNFMDIKKAIPSSFQPYIHSFSTTAKLITFTNDTLRIYQYRF